MMLGGFRGRAPTDADRTRSSAVRAAEARRRAISLAPAIEELRASGAKTLQALADGLNERNIYAPRGYPSLSCPQTYRTDAENLTGIYSMGPMVYMGTG